MIILKRHEIEKKRQVALVDAFFSISWRFFQFRDVTSYRISWRCTVQYCTVLEMAGKKRHIEFSWRFEMEYKKSNFAEKKRLEITEKASNRISWRRHPAHLPRMTASWNSIWRFFRYFYFSKRKTFSKSHQNQTKKLKLKKMNHLVNQMLIYFIFHKASICCPL